MARFKLQKCFFFHICMFAYLMFSFCYFLLLLLICFGFFCIFLCCFIFVLFFLFCLSCLVCFLAFQLVQINNINKFRFNSDIIILTIFIMFVAGGLTCDLRRLCKLTISTFSCSVTPSGMGQNHSKHGQKKNNNNNNNKINVKCSFDFLYSNLLYTINSCQNVFINSNFQHYSEISTWADGRMLY